MRKIIISFLVILMISVIGMTVFFFFFLYYVKNENGSKVEETITNEETTKILENGKILKIEDGMKVEYESDGRLYAITAPEDSTKYSMFNKSRVFILTDALVGHYSILEMPISKHFKETHIIDRTKLFPGLVMTEYYHDPSCKNITDDSFTTTVRANKFQDVEYTFKYVLNDKGELDSIEYLSQKVVKDYTKEIEKNERIWLMVKDGDEIHEDNEYMTVLQSISSSVKQEEYSLDHSGIVEELKNKKFKENVLPIDNNIGYGAYINKDTANYDNKTAEVYLYYWDSHDCEKYLVSFDYNEDYYLSKYEVLNRESISLDEFKKVAHIRKFGWEDKK